MKVAVLFLVALVMAVSASDNVKVLTDATFDEAIQENDLILVKFYAPWCGHCKKLAPEWDAAADTLAEAGDKGVLAKVDCTEESEVCGRYGVRGYPTLKLFRGGTLNAPTDYQNERSADAIVAFLRKKAQPAVVALADADAVKEFVGSDASTAILYSDEAVEAFDKYANLNEDFSFGQAPAALGDVAAGSVVLARSFSNDDVTLDAGFTSQELADFVSKNGYPLVQEIGQDTYQRLAAKPNPILIFVFDDSDRSEWLETLNTIAEDFPTVSIAYGEKAALGRAVESFGGTGNVFPTVIGMKTPAMEGFDGPTANVPERFAYDESNEVNAENVRSFVKDVAAGEVKPFKKSEEVPESNDGPVTVLVHKNFDEYVKDGNNVFIKFYAPWCGHCKTLAPIWEELGEKFAENDVVIAKFDATANFLDERFEVRGFPTLVFVSADGSQETYSGERDLDGLAAFVEGKL